MYDEEGDDFDEDEDNMDLGELLKMQNQLKPGAQNQVSDTKIQIPGLGQMRPPPQPAPVPQRQEPSPQQIQIPQSMSTPIQIQQPVQTKAPIQIPVATQPPPQTSGGSIKITLGGISAQPLQTQGVNQEWLQIDDDGDDYMEDDYYQDNEEGGEDYASQEAPSQIENSQPNQEPSYFDNKNVANPFQDVPKQEYYPQRSRQQPQPVNSEEVKRQSDQRPSENFISPIKITMGQPKPVEQRQQPDFKQNFSQQNKDKIQIQPVQQQPPQIQQINQTQPNSLKPEPSPQTSNTKITLGFGMTQQQTQPIVKPTQDSSSSKIRIGQPVAQPPPAVVQSQSLEPFMIPTSAKQIQIPQTQAPIQIPSQPIQIPSQPIQIPAQPIQIQSSLQHQPPPPQQISQPIKISLEQPQPPQQKPEPYISLPDINMIESSFQPKSDNIGKMKKKKKKLKASLSEVYRLKKISVTVEVDDQAKRMRSFAIYKFELGEKEEVSAKLTEYCVEKQCTKLELNVALQAKQLDCTKVHRLIKNSEGEFDKKELLFTYPDSKEQATYQNAAFQDVPKNLHILETKQQEIFKSEMEKPLMNVKKVEVISFKKASMSEIVDSLQTKLYLRVDYHLQKITDFGIQQISYNKNFTSGFDSASSVNGEQSNTGTYFFTSDVFDQTQNWLPLISGLQFQPVEWNLRFVVPKDYVAVASGKLIQRQVETTGLGRCFYIYKIRELDQCIPSKIGFVIAQLPYMNRLGDIQRMCSDGALAFFVSQKKSQVFTNKNFYEKHILSILNYLHKLIDAKYPCSSIKLVFVPNLFLQSSRKQSINFAGGLHIFDEELLFHCTQLEKRHATYKHLASALSFDYFGNKVFEQSPNDLWLLIGIRESLGNHYKIQKCGTLIYRYHIMQTIQKTYKYMKSGLERYPLQSDNIPHPAENEINDFVYQKCELIMHMIESMIDKSNFQRILRQLYVSADPTISTDLFNKIFRQICGFKFRQFCNNWVVTTSCPKLTASFAYNKKNNSLDLTLTQSSVVKDYFILKKILDKNIQMGTLFQTPWTRKDVKSQILEASRQIDSFQVEVKRECSRWLTGEVNVMIFQTDGAEIQTQQQKMNIKFSQSTISVNFPLHCKVKKTIQNKKKEFDSMMPDYQDDEGHGGGHGAIGDRPHQMLDNSNWKFGMSNIELEEYPHGTGLLFDVKNLESPVLWVRVDPDMEFIRKVEVIQDETNWKFQLLQERDIIGQIEAIRHLYKYYNEMVYKILQAVSTNENYFFKVRKIGLKYMQKMQLSQFNKYLSHEKILMKVFNQRNLFSNSFMESYDLTTQTQGLLNAVKAQTGFYKSNDFTKVLEYYFDKDLLRTLSKCKEQQLNLKPEIKEKLLALSKQQIPSEQPKAGNITINISTNEVLTGATIQNQANKEVNQEVEVLEKQTQISSEVQALMLLKLLQENDNSENPFDDNYYLKTLLKALGNLDCIKLMPQIAQEIYRQFRLDYIAKFSPQFAIMKGAICGYYRMRRRILLFTQEKLDKIDPALEDLNWYKDQILQTEQVLTKMEEEIERGYYDITWPYEIRMYIVGQKIKESFRFKDHSFMKALYLNLKEIDRFQTSCLMREASEYLKILLNYFEKNQFQLDYREMYLVNPKAKAIIDIFWNFLKLPSNYLSCTFLYWVKRLHFFFFGLSYPPVYQDNYHYQGYDIEYDRYWSQVEESYQEQQQNYKDDRDKHLKLIAQNRNSNSIVIKNFPRDQFADNKHKIVLGVQNQAKIPSIQISLGGYQLQQKQENEQQALMKSLSHNSGLANYPDLIPQRSLKKYEMQDEANDDESIYDEFAEVKFDEDWRQKCWDVLGLLWYHEESLAFLEPVSEEDLGAYFAQYLRVIDYPMDFTTMKEKFKAYEYHSIQHFKQDVLQVFKNCQTFNDEFSEIYKSSQKLEKFFYNEMRKRDLLHEYSGSTDKQIDQDSTNQSSNNSQANEEIKNVEDDDLVTAFTIQAASDKGIDYQKLLVKFGCSPMNQELIDKMETLTGVRAHRFIRRGIFFCHRDLDSILTRYEQGKLFYLYTGRGPSAEALHMGHAIPFIINKYLQDAFDVPLVIQVTDDEKFMYRPELGLEQTIKMGKSNIKDIIAFGFNPEKTFIFSDIEYIQYLYPNVIKVQKNTTLNQIKGIFGFNESDPVGKYAYPPIQSVPSFCNTFPHIYGNRTDVPSLIPCAIDQDPYFRMTRDVAAKLKYQKTSCFYSTFFPALQGLKHKMASSDSNSSILLTDKPKEVEKKVSKYAFSGGGATVEEHKRNGANLDVDVPYQWLQFFMEDDDKLAEVREKYGKGEMMTGEVKKLLIQVLNEFLKEFQERRAKVTDEDVKKFMEVRKINPVPKKFEEMRKAKEEAEKLAKQQEELAKAANGQQQ